MAKKKFSSFQEEFEYDYHRRKKVEKAKAWLRLIEIGVILIVCIALIILCARTCSNSIQMMNDLDTVNALS